MREPVYLVEHADIETAERFLANADGSFRDLALHPEIGAPLSFRDPKLAGMRKWRVKGFEKFLIFYLHRPDSVSIIRLLHAGQDGWGLLGIL